MKNIFNAYEMRKITKEAKEYKIKKLNKRIEDYVRLCAEDGESDAILTINVKSEIVDAVFFEEIIVHDLKELGFTVYYAYDNENVNLSISW